jgi:aminoglycoside/choline kinase family phosphotransferase/dTDP-glucose pyrophosphorylase
VHKIGINLHHKKELIENWIRQSAFNNKVELFPEDQMLGTGGALKNAEAFLNTGTFLVHNSDIVSDINLGKLIECHLSSNNLLTLAVHDHPQFNNLVVDEHQLLRNVCKARCMPLKPLKLSAFTGIAVYSPEFLRFLPQGFSSVVDAWLQAVSAGYKIGTLDVSGCSWSDIGTPVTYASTVINELRQNGETVFVHPSIEVCKRVELDGYVVVEKGVSLDKGVSLRNCILLLGSITESSAHYENCIIGPGFKIDLHESEMLGSYSETDALLIGTGGSNRKYYRVKRNNSSIVFMQCHKDDPDFHRHVEYTRFFQRHSIPVPELLNVEPETMSALFEDLGDLSLYSYLKCPREQEEIEEVYKRVIDILILMHTAATEHLTECPLLQNRIFDYEHLRWETSYFIERFIEGVRDIRVENLSALNNEFHRLALNVDSFPKTVIHRDFQSQNIMIIKGGIPRVVDYQGARIGPPAYDVVSLLWDPYYRFEDDMREQLLEYYIEKMSESFGIDKDHEINPLIPPLAKGGKGGFFNKIEFKQTLLPCRLQRHMQALGAYGFLSKIKGKKYFLKHVPEGLRLLKENTSLSRDEYPELYDLVMGL